MTPRMLSVVTINYNNRDGLQRTLGSVFAQTYRQIESIVIDGASTDGSADYLRELKASNFRFISEPDHGIYDAMQKGLSQIRADAVIFLINSDDIVERIAEHVNIANTIVLGRIHMRGSAKPPCKRSCGVPPLV